MSKHKITEAKTISYANTLPNDLPKIFKEDIFKDINNYENILDKKVKAPMKTELKHPIITKLLDINVKKSTTVFEDDMMKLDNNKNNSNK